MTTSTPYVTVYIPVFNSEQYIAEAIDSILNQTFFDFELIIIDDGSTDKTQEVILSYKDPRIHFISNKKNLGVRKSANIALRQAKGKYIVRVDADDVSLPNRLQTQIDFMENNLSVGVSSCQLQLFGNENGIWNFPLTNDECKAELIWGTTITQPASVIRTSIIRENNIFYDEEGESYAEDWDFFYRLKDITEFGNINEVLVKYRRHSQSITRRFREKSYQLNLQLFKKILNNFGINASEYELSLHLFANTQIKEKPDEKIVFQVRKWLNRLIEHNNKINFFPKDAFRKICKKKWNQLFFYLVPHGHLVVFAYFMITGISWSHFIYYLKYSANKIIGRKNN